MIMDGNNNIPELWLNDHPETVLKELLEETEGAKKKGEDCDKEFGPFLVRGSLEVHAVKERGVGLER